MPAYARVRVVSWTLLCILCVLASAAAAPALAPNKGRFELVTYNVAGLPEGISRSHPLANLAPIGKLLSAYDIALVQEDFAYPEELRRGLQLAHGSPAFVRGERLDFGDGLSQFSRLAFSGFQRVPWSACHGVIDSFFDCLTPKGFTIARQTLAEGVFVQVVNLHMDAGWSPGDRAARAAQVDQLLAALPQREALIVAGDTNLSPKDGSVLERLLATAELKDACAELGCAQPGRIDRVLYRSSAEVSLRARKWRIASEFVDNAGRPLSDHLAVSVAFEWQRLR